MSQHRDLIVVGASAGGVHALPVLLASLPRQLPASVVIVLHMAPGADRYLADILQRSSKLPVTWAEQGAPLELGHVYVAPPDYHTVFADGHLRLDGGARENHSRPSINRTFRSAAGTYGGRTIGVVLTGMLDDGAAGLAAIREVGGRAIVQDPSEAEYPEMPRMALAQVGADFTVGLSAIGEVLRSLVAEPAPTRPIPHQLALETQLDGGGPSATELLGRLGEQTTSSCRECHGPLWKVGHEGARTYRCALGHTATARTLLADSHEDVERALWMAIRSLHDRASTYETLARDAERVGNTLAAASYHTKAKETQDATELARQFMLELLQRTSP